MRELIVVNFIIEKLFDYFPTFSFILIGEITELFEQVYGKLRETETKLDAVFFTIDKESKIYRQSQLHTGRAGPTELVKRK